jgi:hypothetical protein
MGQEKKKGDSGIAAGYITRSQALRKLHITLKDFRCALLPNTLLQAS